MKNLIQPHNSIRPFLKGDRVIIKPEFSDGDDRFPSYCAEDADGGRVLIVHDCGFSVNPTEVIPLEMIAHAE